MGEIILENVRIYAFHGCMEEEARIGSDYVVDLKIKTNMDTAMRSDALEDAVDSVSLNTILKREMSIRSKLLEHVAHRIVSGIFSELPNVMSVSLSVAKKNPPIGGDMNAVKVKIKENREWFNRTKF